MLPLVLQLQTEEGEGQGFRKRRGSRQGNSVAFEHFKNSLFWGNGSREQKQVGQILGEVMKFCEKIAVEGKSKLKYSMSLNSWC